MADKKLIAPVEQIEARIFVIRGQKVMLDADLAELYGVETKVLNQAVKRNLDRFPDDFMFQLSPEEFANLKSQIGISSLRSLRYVKDLRCRDNELSKGWGQIATPLRPGLLTLSL